MIISVMHTGTRSVLRLLGLEGHGLGVFKHFGEHDDWIAAFTGHADVPIRDPVQVVMAWQSRYPAEQVPHCLNHLGRLIEYASDRADTTFYVVENLESKVGEGEGDNERDEAAARALVGEWLTPERRAFYRRFYETFE